MDDGTCLAVQCHEPPSRDDGLCDKHRAYSRRKARPGIPTRIVNDLPVALRQPIRTARTVTPGRMGTSTSDLMTVLGNARRATGRSSGAIGSASGSRRELHRTGLGPWSSHPSARLIGVRADVRVNLDAAAVARALGWTPSRLRVWRHRHPGILEPIAHTRHNRSVYRMEDVRHAEEHINGSCTRTGCNV